MRDHTFASSFLLLAFNAFLLCCFTLVGLLLEAIFDTRNCESPAKPPRELSPEIREFAGDGIFRFDAVADFCFVTDACA